MSVFYRSVCAFLIFVLGAEAGFVGTYLYVHRCPVASRTCPACQPHRTLRDIQKATVHVAPEGGGHGSGTIGWVNGELFVLTADHVTTKGEKATVGFEKDGEVGMKIPAVCVYSSRDHDLALLKLEWEPLGPWPNLTPVDDVELGEEAIYCGWGGSCPMYLEKGIVQNRYVDFKGLLGYKVFLVSGNGMAGNSGSAVWVKRGDQYHLAGVILRGWCPGAPMICHHPIGLKAFLDERPKEGCQDGCCPAH